MNLRIVRPSKPKVSIGLPVYNGEEYLRGALDSALSQTLTDFELIISDNASEDATSSICHKYVDLDPRIRYFRQQANIGSHANFMFVLNQSQGEYFTWLAHDDLLESSYLEIMTAYISSRPDVALVSSDFIIMDSYGALIKHEILKTIRPGFPWRKRRIEFFTHPITNVYFCIYGLMRTTAGKHIASEYIEQKSRLLTGSERPILSRLAVSGEIVSIPLFLRKYRNHPVSSYFTEVKRLSKLAPLKRLYELNLNINVLRLDQLKVILRSDLPVITKLDMFMQLIKFYSQHFSKKIIGIPANLIRLLKANRRSE